MYFPLDLTSNGNFKKKLLIEKGRKKKKLLWYNLKLEDETLTKKILENNFDPLKFTLKVFFQMIFFPPRIWNFFLSLNELLGLFLFHKSQGLKPLPKFWQISIDALCNREKFFWFNCNYEYLLIHINHSEHKSRVFFIESLKICNHNYMN